MQFRGERVHVGLQFREDTAHHRQEKHGKRSTRSNWFSGSREREQEMGSGYTTSKLTSRVILPPRGFQLLQLPQLSKTVLPAGDQVYKPTAPRGIFHIRPNHNSTHADKDCHIIFETCVPWKSILNYMRQVKVWNLKNKKSGWITSAKAFWVFEVAIFK